jgi:hypothetical protein
MTRELLHTTWGLLQGWLEVGAIGSISLLCIIRAGQTSLDFYLLTCTFKSLLGSGSGQTQY